MTDKVKLFETVLGIASKGAASLTASERTVIENETRELLSASSRKTAAKAPEGFELLLDQLKHADNADEAFEKVLEFLKSNDKAEDSIEKAVEPVEHKEDLLPGLGKDKEIESPLHEMKEEKEEKGLSDLVQRPGRLNRTDESDKKDSPIVDKKEDKVLPFADKKEDKVPPFAEKKEEKPFDLDKEKKDIFARVKASEEMEVKDPVTASKVRVRITSSRNLLVSFDGKPLFHAVPNDAVKADINQLKRLANKVYAWVVYEGADSAAKKCGAKMFAGVDDDVQPSFDDAMTPEETKGVADDGEVVTEEKPDDAEDTSMKGAEFVTEETPKEVKTATGIQEGGTEVTEEKQDAKPESSSEGAEVVTEEKPGDPAKDIRDEADTNYAHVEANFKTLYAARAQKLAKEAQDKFIERFTRALKIASARMLKNYEEHPFKAAAMDVLTDSSFKFSDGAEFTGLYSSDAQELIEHMASVGHEQFVDHLLGTTASLMEKSDEYLTDLESDLGTLKAKALPVEEPVNRNASVKSNRARKEASEGNFVINSAPVTRTDSGSEIAGVRDAIGNTLLARNAGVLKQLLG